MTTRVGVSRVIAALLVMTGIFCLVAVRPNSPEQVPDGFVRVQYWEKWTGEEKDQMQEIVDWFNRTVGREKRIFVEYTSMTAVNQKTLIATAAGVPPDVAGLWGEQVVQFASLDAIQPLDELAAGHGINSGYYKRVYWDLCSYKGRLRALISTPANMTLHYRKRIFWDNADKLRSVGLDPHHAPRTLDELDRYAEVLTVRDPGHSQRILRAGYLPSEPGWYIQHMPLWFGGTIFDEQTGQFGIAGDASVRAFDWVQEYARRLGADGIAEFRGGLGGFNSTANPFITGQVVMVQQGPWMANYLNNLAPDMSQVLVPKVLELVLPRVLREYNYDWGVAPFPSGQPGMDDITICNADVLVIPRGAPHPHEAFEFIAFVNRPDVMERLCSLHCKNSPLAKSSEEFVRKHLNPYIATFERLADSPNARGIPQIPIWPEVESDVVATSQEILLLKSSAAEALTRCQRRMEEKYSRYLALQRARASEN